MRKDVMNDEGYRALWDGKSLHGWRSIPRVYGTLYPGGPGLTELLAQYEVRTPPNPEEHPPLWSVVDGVLIGEQDTPGSGYGGYLITEEAFGDFDLAFEMKHDWPADTGVMLRRGMDDWAGFQVLIDHRPSGGIGGFFGNGLDSFSALPFAIEAIVDGDGVPVGLRQDSPETSLEPVTQEKIDRLSYAASADEFLAVWRWADWNEMRIRCVGGALPTITTWVNGVKIAEIDTATIKSENYNSTDVSQLLGTHGHIALEVHDNDSMFGAGRWGHGAQCRWRNIQIREYPTEEQ